MRILHVIASLAPRYGGPSVACPALCRELARRGHDVSIYTTNVDGDWLTAVPLDQPTVSEGVEVRCFPGWTSPPEYKFSLPLARALQWKIPRVDVVHIYSMYIFSATAAAHYCRRYGVPYLLHPHGTLDPFLLRRHAARKWLYTVLFERRNFRHAAAILFNSEAEKSFAADWLKQRLPAGANGCLPTPVVIPVGVEEEWLEFSHVNSQEAFYRKFPQLKGRQLVLFFGRLSFKKGMDIAADAFAQVARQYNNAHLVLAGPDTEGYGVKVKQWLRDRGVLERATFTGTLVGEERFAALRAASVFLLPSYSENFGQAVAEAMACGVPVVISNHVNIWPDVQRSGAGLVVRCDPKDAADAVLTLLGNPSLCAQMGARGRQWVEEKLTWRVVGEQMFRLYEQIAGQTAVRAARSQPLRELTRL